MKLVCSLPAWILLGLVGAAAAAQDLSADWAETLVSGAWHGQCLTEGRGGCREGQTYFLESDSGVLVSFTSSAPPPTERLLVASSTGDCARGEITTDGGSMVELVGAGNHCAVAGGKFFRDASRITNTQSQLAIDGFRNARTIQVNLELTSGSKVAATIPMEGFEAMLEVARGPSGRGC